MNYIYGTIPEDAVNVTYTGLTTESTTTTVDNINRTIKVDTNFNIADFLTKLEASNTYLTKEEGGSFVHKGTASVPASAESRYGALSIYGDLNVIGADSTYPYASKITFGRGMGSVESSGSGALDIIAGQYLTLKSHHIYFSDRSSSPKRAELLLSNITSGTTRKLTVQDKDGTIATLNDCTKLYRHHFDVVLTNADLSLIPEDTQVHINVNALSTSGTAWQILSELDGGGFIVSAFGNIPNNFNYIFELKLFYASLGNGTLLLNIHNLTTNTVKAVAITTVGGGQSPNIFALQDSVTPL